MGDVETSGLMIYQEVTKLTHKQANDYFKESRNFVNFDIPEYFDFTELLKISSALLFGKSIEDICSKKIVNGKPKVNMPCDSENVNHTILDNKDGFLAWRPLQIIHPILYVDLVNFITEEKNWKVVVKRFNDFAKSRVTCVSIPKVSLGASSHKASQVVHWWEEIEQLSIELSLDYTHIYITDITNCYATIYTHSIDWALTKGGKQQAKKNRFVKPSSLGAEIDKKIRNMTYGQTNGIPQGSTLMDFVAEIVLGYGDVLLTEALDKILPKNEKFKILRYRDDYKIFVNNPITGRTILKELNEVLRGLGMKMNPNKTLESEDVISSSIKREKLERFYLSPSPQDYQKEALRIYQLSRQYPNAGLITKELNIYYDEKMAGSRAYKKTSVNVLISIFSMIAISSPKSIPWVCTILAKLLETNPNYGERRKIIKLIRNRLRTLSNAGFIDIWLQRISAPLKVSFGYHEKLTKTAVGLIKNSNLWNCAWLKRDVVSILNKIPIVSTDISKLSPTITRKEVELFRKEYA